MRIFSWVGGVVLIAVIGTGTAGALRSHNDSAHGLTASSPVIAYYGSDTGGPGSHRHLRPSPVPLPTPRTPRSTTRTSSAPSQPRQVAPAPPAPVRPAPPPSIVIGSTQQVLINRDRAAAGRPPLSWRSCLYSVALANAKRMAAQGYISHTNGVYLDLACHVGSQSGENVGWWSRGINDTQLNTMFMNSPEHRANIMGPYHYVATAWAVAPNGYAYIAVEFS